jgi:zinc protease
MPARQGWRFAALLLTLVALPDPARCQDTPVPQLPVESYKLANGLKVALSHDPAAPRTTVCVAYHVGSKNERAGLTGFAHFFEHMMFRGTENVPNFDVPLQEAGASPNAFTSEDVTVYFETVPSHFLQRALYMEAERMAFLHTALDQHKFDTEREVVKNERRQVMENVPYGLADETLQAYLYPDSHPYQWSVIGSMRDLDNASLEDLRQFFFEFYHPGNATLTLVGSFDPAAARQWIEHYFGPIVSGEPIADVAAPPVPPVNRRVTQTDSVQFPKVYWAWPSVAETHADAPALDLLADILADGDASRLYQALVVEQRLASVVNASSDTSQLGGLFTIDATAAPQQSLDAIEQVLASRLEQIRSQGPSQEELQRALIKHEVRTLQNLASPMSRAFIIGMGYAQYDDPHYYRKLFTDYAGVTVQDVQRVAEKYLTPDKLVLSIVPVQPGEAESAAELRGPVASDVAPISRQPRAAPAGPAWSELPPPAQATAVVPPSIHRGRLANGLEVWISPWNSLPLVSAQLVIPCGSAHDPEGKSGLANLTSEVWTQGTQDLTSTQFTELMDGLGVPLDVHLSIDSTSMNFTSASGRLDEVLRQVAPLLSQPRLDERDIAREKDLMLSQLARGPDNPNWIASRVFPKLLYGSHPYSSPPLGYQKSVADLARDDIAAFFRQHFTPGGAKLIIVGDVDPPALLQTLNDVWGSWQGSASGKLSAQQQTYAAPHTVYIVHKPGAVQSVLTSGRVWVDRRHPSYIATLIGNRVLGGDFLSRINQNLREQNGYTYGARSDFRYWRSGGDWLVRTSVRADVTGAALRELLNELESPLKMRPFTDEEIDVARQAELNEFPQSFETPPQIVQVLAEMAEHNLPTDYPAQFVAQLQQVSAADVTGAMTQLLNEQQRATLVVGDRNEIASQLQKAGFQTFMTLDTDGNVVVIPDNE